MPDNATLSAGTLYGFLLVFARVGGSLIFVPLPGVKSAPEPARIALALGFTLALYSQWPVVRTDAVTVGTLAGWALAEAAVGLAIGFIAGLVISLVQIATSMQDNAFSTIPRLLAFLAGLLFLLPWMLHRMMGYTIALFGDLGRYAR